MLENSRRSPGFRKLQVTGRTDGPQLLRRPKMIHRCFWCKYRKLCVQVDGVPVCRSCREKT